MPKAIQDFCRETKQPVPKTEGELVRCAYESLALKYRGLALSFKAAVNDGELPTRRGLRGPDRVATAEEVDIFDDIAGPMNSGQRWPEAKIHVGQEAMLGVAGAHGHSAGVPILDLDVEVRERRVEGAGTGIGNGCVGAVRVGRSSTPEAGAAAGEEYQHLFVGRVLESGCVGGQDKDGPLGAVADQANAGPNIERAADAIASCWQEHDALTGRLLNLVNGVLQGGRVIARAGAGEINRLGIRQALGVIGGWPGQWRGEENGGNRQTLEHRVALPIKRRGGEGIRAVACFIGYRQRGRRQVA